MTLKNILLIIAGLFLVIPFLTYFTIWWGVSGYHRAKAFTKKYEQDYNDDNNSSVNDDG